MTRPGRFQCARCQLDDLSARESAAHRCPRSLPPEVEEQVKANLDRAYARARARAEIDGLVASWDLDPLTAASLLEGAADRLRSEYEAQKRRGRR